jgi:hypothetical protein
MVHRYNMATRNVTFMKLNARKFLTEIEPDAPFFLCGASQTSPISHGGGRWLYIACRCALHVRTNCTLHAVCRMPHAARLHAARRVACARYVGFGDCHRCAEGSAIGAFCEYYGADGTIPDWPNPKQVTGSLTVQHVPYETALSTCSLCCNGQPYHAHHAPCAGTGSGTP